MKEIKLNDGLNTTDLLKSLGPGPITGTGKLQPEGQTQQACSLFVFFTAPELTMVLHNIFK